MSMESVTTPMGCAVDVPTVNSWLRDQYSQADATAEFPQVAATVRVSPWSLAVARHARAVLTWAEELEATARFAGDRRLQVEVRRAEAAHGLRNAGVRGRKPKDAPTLDRASTRLAVQAEECKRVGPWAEECLRDLAEYGADCLQYPDLIETAARAYVATLGIYADRVGTLPLPARLSFAEVRP
jgi:hypothetical protein